MYYKVIKDNRVIDVLDELIYVKYQKKHSRMLLCKKEEAQAILSSDHKYAWHIAGLNQIPVNGYDTVKLVPIDVYEYDQLKCLNLKSVEDILAEYTLLLLEGGIL